jgi:hypothetical protein
MAIEKNYNKTIKTQRLYDDSGIGEEYFDYLTGVSCHIQPLDEAFSTDLDGSFGKNFLMFCKVQDIREGDKIVDGSTVYRVTGEDSYNFNDEDKHMELTIRKFIS